MNAYDLYTHYSIEELVEMQQAIMDDPANANLAHAEGTSIYLYTKTARKKMSMIAWAITHHLQDKRKGDS